MLRSAQVMRPHVPCHVLVDFDGTIAAVDTTDALLDQFALPEWQDIEADWKAGNIGSRECMVRQVDLIRATPGAMDAFIATLKIDPDVPAFMELCRMRGLEVSVVSDGLDRTVTTVLLANGIRATTRANALQHRGGDRWKLGFPHAREDCKALSGNCKCATPDRTATSLRVVVGDGRSDFCVSEQADFVLAKDKLVAHAKAKHLPYASFTTFADASRKLVNWLDGPVAASINAQQTARVETRRP